MNTTFNETVIKPLTECYGRVLDFLPDLLASLFILALGEIGRAHV